MTYKTTLTDSEQTLIAQQTTLPLEFKHLISEIIDAWRTLSYEKSKKVWADHIETHPEVDDNYQDDAF